MPENDKNRTDLENSKTAGRLAAVGLLFLELVRVVLIAVVTIVLIRYFLFKPFYVKGQSMEPNFSERDYLIIDELTYRLRAPERGEVIVFKAPNVRDEYYLKRILGLPGERIKIEDDKVIVFNLEYPKGKIVEEGAYLREQTQGSLTVTLGADEYFVMGDNRDASFDSRRFGPIRRNSIVGRAWLRGWPVSKIQTFQAPDYKL
jgi:signal peptidase I